MRENEPLPVQPLAPGMAPGAPVSTSCPAPEVKGVFASFILKRLFPFCSSRQLLFVWFFQRCRNSIGYLPSHNTNTRACLQLPQQHHEGANPLAARWRSDGSIASRHSAHDPYGNHPPAQQRRRAYTDDDIGQEGM